MVGQDCTRVPRVPLRTKPTASPTGEWEGPTRLATGHIHAHSSRCHAPQGLRGAGGPTALGAIPYGRPRCRCARSAAFLHRPERTGTSGGRSWHTCDELKTQAASAAVSECLRRHAGRHAVWVHGKVAGIGWRARFDCAYHRCSRRGFSGRHLLHHLLTRHSTRRRAPEKLPFFSHPARARPAFGNRAS